MTLDPRRKGLLTASDFGAAVGLNPYCSRQQLWRLKTGREVFEGNDQTQYGKDNEHHAIAKYEAITGEFVEPGAFCVNEAYPELGCTPDGRILDGSIIEVKCPTSGIYREPPIYYLAQVIGQMEIVGADRCYFVAWSSEETKIWLVHHSPAAFAWMLPKLMQMVVFIKTGVEPPRAKKPNKDDFLSLIRYNVV